MFSHNDWVRKYGKMWRRGVLTDSEVRAMCREQSPWDDGMNLWGMILKIALIVD